MLDLRPAFDADDFRRQGHVLVDRLAASLAGATAGQGPVLPWTPPDDLAAAWPPSFPEEGGGDLAALVDRVLAGSNHLHHPRFVGHQVTPPLPQAALLELVGAFLNNGMAVYEMGPVATAMERAVIAWLGAVLGFPAACGGVLTSGGSLGNLTALLAARQVHAGFDAWSGGGHAGPPLSALATAETHYCVARAAAIMGWGQEGVAAVPTDAAHRMRPEALEDVYRAALARGRRVIAVVASAGSTATGAYDPLPAIADFCQERRLWLHVDGAHGASAALSPKYRHLVAGIERADSVVWDAHKLLLQPALVTAVLFRDERHSYEAFAQEASYIFVGGRPPWYDVGARTLECTKRMMSLHLYGTLALSGTRLFADAVTATYDLARRFAEMIGGASDFELALPPESNIVCFRHRPAGGDPRALDAHQADIRRRLVESGGFYLVQTTLPQRGVFLRTALMNPLTTEADLAALLDAIRTTS